MIYNITKVRDRDMKLLIAGSRGIDNFDLSQYITDDVDTILSGGAKGIDTLAEEYADKKRLSKIILRPRYDLYGKAAPIKRNEELVKNGRQDTDYLGRRIKGYEINYKLCRKEQ